MNIRKSLFFLILIFIVVGVVVALPIALQAVPSRYIAYATEKLPEPLKDPFKQIAEPQQEVAILPTAVPVSDVDAISGNQVAQESQLHESPAGLPALVLSWGGGHAGLMKYSSH